MNNPFEYQNDLSALNSQFEDMHQQYKNKLATAKSDSLIKRGQNLAKQSQDLASAGRKASSAVGEIVGGAAAKKLVSGIIKPGVENAVKGIRGGIKTVKSLASRFSGGGEAEEEAGEEAEEPLAEGLQSVGKGLTRAITTARPEGDMQMTSGANQGKNLDEEQEDGEGFNEDESTETKGDDGEAGEEAEGGEGAEGGESALDDALDTGADAIPDVLPDVIAPLAEGAGDAALAGGAGAVAGADWWNPVGWVAGLVAVGAGIASIVEAGDDSNAASAAGNAANVKTPYSPPTSFAGRYVVPVNNSLSVF